MTLDLKETVKTSIYSPKHTKNTDIHITFSQKSKINISNKKEFKQISVLCCFVWHYLYLLLRATQPNYFSPENSIRWIIRGEYSLRHLRAMAWLQHYPPTKTTPQK